MWAEYESSLDLLQFPEDFVTRSNEGELFDLPAGEVEVGEAMMDTDGLLGVGKIRVGGRDGDVMEAGSVSRARFLQALSRCHRTGRVRLPADDVCDDAVSSFDQYQSVLRNRCSELARQRTVRPAPPESRGQRAGAQGAPMGETITGLELEGPRTAEKLKNEGRT